MSSGDRCRGRVHMWGRALVLVLVVAVVAAACGTNAEDRDRLAALKTDGLWAVDRPPGVMPDPIRAGEVLADNDSAVVGDTSTGYWQVYEIEPGVDHNQLLRDYAEILSDLGWPSIGATCGYDLLVGAARWSDGYLRVLRIRVLEANPGADAIRKTDELMISLSAPFHSIDSEPPVESVDLSCIQEPAL